MLPQITKALTSGFTATQIIDFILKKFPTHSKKINEAKKLGFNAEQILSFLSGGKRNESSQEGKTEYEQTREKDIRKRENIEKGALAAATLAGTSALAPAAISATANLPPMIQSLLTPNPKTRQQTTPQQPPVVPNNIQQTQQNITQPIQNIQPEINLVQAEEYLKKNGLLDSVKDFLSRGNPPEVVAAALGMKRSGRAEVDPELLKNIEAYAQKETKQTQEQASLESKGEKLDVTKETIEINKVPDLGKMASGITDNFYSGVFDSLKQGKDTFSGVKEPLIQKAKPLFDKGLIKSPEDLKKFANGELKDQQKIEKNATVAIPQGVGEVKGISNGQALVEVDGKVHKVPEEELETEPEDVIKTVQELLKIPEVDRSSIVSLFTYDPDDKEMYIQFHNGETYKYFDVDSEKVFKVANKMGIPVTQGKNIFGAWSPEDKKSLGATLIKEIINDPKYKKPKKGEKENPNYRQLETLYDYWEKLRKKSKRKGL